ncbi:Glutathione S-transferase lancl1 [Blyttiomyces sp. JEL0837]|nr:Glutathione S-transferase lancl1 [Blyttiomyces sp. JEL0837]
MATQETREVVPRYFKNPYLALASTKEGGDAMETESETKPSTDPLLIKFAAAAPEAATAEGPIHEILTEVRGELVRLAQQIKTVCVIDRETPYDVYHGDSGFALLFLRIHERDPALVIDGAPCLSIAVTYVESALTKVAAENAHLLHSGHHSHRCGFIGSAAGAYAVAAAVYHHAGVAETRDEAINLLVQMKKIAFEPSAASELLYGRAGYLYALLFARYHCGASAAALIPDSLISDLHECIVFEGKEGSKRTFTKRSERDKQGLGESRIPGANATTPLMWSWHMERYVGAAHGTTGILTILMSDPLFKVSVQNPAGAKSEAESHQESVQADIKSTIRSVMRRRGPNGNYPIRVDESLYRSGRGGAGGGGGECLYAM